MHSLYSFLVKNLTIPKVKDLVHKPQTQYESILRSLTEKDDRYVQDANGKAEEKDLSINQIEMKNELKSYIKDLKAGRRQEKEEREAEVSQHTGSSSSFSAFDNYDVTYVDSVGTMDGQSGYNQQISLSHSVF